MSKGRGSGFWMQVLKLALAAALVLFVLSRVDLVDRSITRDRSGEVVEEVEGTILGDWQAPRIRFRPSEGGEVRELRPGPLDGGLRLEVRPGLPTYVKQIRWWLFLAGAMFFFVVASFSSLRWWWLLRINDLEVSIFQAYRLTWIGIFFNNLVPGLTGGDLVKAFYVARLTGKKARPIMAVLVDRALGLIALGLVAAIAVLFRWEAFAEIGLLIWAGLLALLLGSTLFLSRRVRRRFRLDRLLNRLPASEVLKQCDQAIHFYRDHLPGIFVWLLLSMLNHVGAVLGVCLIADALGMGVPWSEHLVLVPVINIGSALPLAPSGWGVGEAMYSFLYGKYCTSFLEGAVDAARIMGTRAIALSVVYRIHLMLWSLLGAVFLLFQKGRASQEEMSHLMEDLDEEA